MIYLFDINDFSRNDSFNAEPESLTYTSHSLYWYCSGNSGFQAISCISGTLISPPFTNIPCYVGVYFGRHPIFGHHNFANRGRVTYDFPLHTKTILGFTIVSMISLQPDAFSRWPLWKKCGRMTSPSRFTTPKTLDDLWQCPKKISGKTNVADRKKD